MDTALIPAALVEARVALPTLSDPADVLAIRRDADAAAAAARKLGPQHQQAVRALLEASELKVLAEWRMAQILGPPRRGRPSKESQGFTKMATVANFEDEFGVPERTVRHWRKLYAPITAQRSEEFTAQLREWKDEGRPVTQAMIRRWTDEQGWIRRPRPTPPTSEVERAKADVKRFAAALKAAERAEEACREAAVRCRKRMGLAADDMARRAVELRLNADSMLEFAQAQLVEVQQAEVSQ